MAGGARVGKREAVAILRISLMSNRLAGVRLR
jgi:hypothetical protein